MDTKESFGTQNIGTRGSFEDNDGIFDATEGDYDLAKAQK